MEWKSNSHIKAALEILRREFQPSQVYLFGSRANGAVSLDSDIDLLLVIPETEESRLSRQLRAHEFVANIKACLLYTSPSPRDATLSRMPSSA